MSDRSPGPLAALLARFRVRPRRGSAAVRGGAAWGPAVCGAAVERLERRTLLTVYTVDTSADTVAADGRVSLREAVTAANTDAAVGDAPAGTAADRVVFASDLSRTAVRLRSTLRITGPLVLAGRDAVLTGPAGGGPVLDVVGPDGSQVVLYDVQVRGGRAEAGGGIRFRGDRAALGLVRVSFRGNSAAAGGGLHQSGGRVLVREGLFLDNTADDGAAAAVAGGSLGLVATRVFRNTAANLGGGVHAGGSAVLRVRGGRIDGNTAGAAGGGIAVTGNARLVAADADLSGNAADGTAGSGDGGGLAVGPRDAADPSGTPSALLSDSLVFRNTAAGHGGGVAAGAGAAVRLLRTTLAANDASRGGGVATDGTATLGAVALRNNLARVGRHGGSGGGVQVGRTGSLRARDTLFRVNDAEGAGGAIHNAGAASLRRSRVTVPEAGRPGSAVFHTAGSRTTLTASAVSVIVVFRDERATTSLTPDDGRLVTGNGTVEDDRTAGGPLRLTTPRAGAVVQRTGTAFGGGAADVSVAGTYDPAAFGSDGPGRILARWTAAAGPDAALDGPDPDAAGPWVVLDATPTGGRFSGVLAARPAGWATLEVRAERGGSAAGTGAVASVPVASVPVASVPVAVGDVLLVAGQSNADGRALRVPFPGGGAGLASVHDGGGWSSLTEFSAWPLFADRLTRSTGVPLGLLKFTPPGTGLGVGRFDDARWDPAGGGRRGGAAYRDLLTRVDDTGVDRFAAVLWQHGASDAKESVGRAEYRAALARLVAAFRQDLPGAPRTIVAQLGQFLQGGAVDPIRLAQADLWAAGGRTGSPHALPGPVLYDIETARDGIHYHLPDQLARYAERFVLSVRDALFGGPSSRGPRLTAATVRPDGRSVTLAFDRPLVDAGRYDGFTLTADGRDVPVAAAVRSGRRTVLLVLRAAVAGTDVKVSLGRGPATGGLRVPGSPTGGVLLPAEYFVDADVRS